MIITNNGEEFHMKNVESISEVHSTKVGKNTIGYWGIGFKSIFWCLIRFRYSPRTFALNLIRTDF